MLMGAFHVVLEVTAIVVLDAADPELHVVGDSVDVGVIAPAVCVTVTVLVIPPPVTVMVPVR